MISDNNISGWLVYILQLEDDTYYTGITNDLQQRVEAHENGTGSKYVYSRLPLRVVYTQAALDRSEASKVEYSIKKLKRSKKIKIIEECKKCACGIALSGLSNCVCGRKCKMEDEDV